MAEVDLLRRYPRSKRNVAARNSGRTPEAIALSKQFGEDYFDGARETGYGGYRYDGRWLPVAEDIAEHFGLRAGQRVLDVGSAKGFLLKDLQQVVPGIEVTGLDVSAYALSHAEPEITGRLVRGSAEHLPFDDDSFDVVVSINAIHNLHVAACTEALREIERVGSGRAYVQVDSYRDDEERRRFLDWVLTAETHGPPSFWEARFSDAGYQGDWYWTITE